MKIFITGYSGSLGNIICEKYSEKNKIFKINLRNINFDNSDELNNLLNKFNEADVVINCAASLKPKNKSDFFINENFPKLLAEHLELFNKKSVFLHISTINVLIKKREDNYTKSKRIAEKKLQDTKSTIIRLPLMYQQTNGLIEKFGNLTVLFKYLNYKLPIHPMIYPGHSFEPLDVDKMLEFLEKLMFIKNDKIKFFNLSGGTKIHLWDLYENIANQKKKKILKINISKLIPTFLINILIKKNNFLQQFVEIDNTQYNEEKTVLN
tara:strand:- start:2309 stop:3106 length:798 start_codon:yes stop_codon:yes gene_type:complete